MDNTSASYGYSCRMCGWRIMHAWYFIKLYMCAYTNGAIDCTFCNKCHFYLIVYNTITRIRFMNSISIYITCIAMLCSVACVLPGIFLMLRGVALMSDAISHAILPGIVIMFLLVKQL